MKEVRHTEITFIKNSVKYKLVYSKRRSVTADGDGEQKRGLTEGQEESFRGGDMFLTLIVVMVWKPRRYPALAKSPQTCH